MNELCFMSNLTSGDLASWVQAIGSIAAILASAGFVQWQHNNQVTLAAATARSEQAAKTDATFQLVDAAYRMVEELDRAYASTERINITVNEAALKLTRLRGMVLALGSTDFMRLGKNELIQPVLVAWSTMNILCNRIEVGVRKGNMAHDYSDIQRDISLLKGPLKAALDGLHAARAPSTRSP